MCGLSCVAGERGAGGGGANSFVIVEGRGVGVTESGDIWYDVGSAGSIRVTARSGWLVNGRESVTLDPSSGTVGGIDVTSRLQEDSQHIHVFPCVTDNAHARDVVTRTATAKIDPAPMSVTYNWTRCGRCGFLGVRDGVNVTYGANDETGASGSYLEEPLTVSASVWNGTGQSATASCTTNFTVVAVDVSVDGAGEGTEETSPPSVIYSRKLTRFAIDNMMPVKIICKPKNLPDTELVWLTLTDNIDLFEMKESGVPARAKSSFRYNEIGGKTFGLLGRPPYGEILDSVNGAVTVEHYGSGAKDLAKVKVVPPSLELSVDLISPSGKWPYDPVWNDPAWSLSLNGVTNMVCAKNDDRAIVQYSLSKDADDGLITIKKSALVFTTSIGDCEVDSFEEGMHRGTWIMPKDLSEGSYFAEFVAFDAENGEKHSVKSGAGSVVRGDFYTAETKRENQIGIKITELDVDKDGLLRGCMIPVFVAMPFLALPNGPVYASGGAAVQGMLGYYVNKQLPDWINTNTLGLVWEWEATHWEWNDAASKYEEVKDSSFNVPAADPDFGTVTLETKGKFIIGYVCFRTPKTYVADGKPACKLVTCESGYYSYENQRIGILGSNADAPKYYNLEKSWRWLAKPYGLREPKIEE